MVSLAFCRGQHRRRAQHRLSQTLILLEKLILLCEETILFPELMERLYSATRHAQDVALCAVLSSCGCLRPAFFGFFVVVFRLPFCWPIIRCMWCSEMCLNKHSVSSWIRTRVEKAHNPIAKVQRLGHNTKPTVGPSVYFGVTTYQREVHS